MAFASFTLRERMASPKERAHNSVGREGEETAGTHCSYGQEEEELDQGIKQEELEKGREEMKVGGIAMEVPGRQKWKRRMNEESFRVPHTRSQEEGRGRSLGTWN